MMAIKNIFGQLLHYVSENVISNKTFGCERLSKMLIRLKVGAINVYNYGIL